MTQEQQSILNYLQNNANTQANKKTSDDICINCNVNSGGRTNEHIRDLIKDMILNNGAIIASDNNGYWIPNTSNEVIKVCSSLYNRANAINQRANALKQNWNTANHSNQIP